jgi:hypothetical protein
MRKSTASLCQLALASAGLLAGSAHAAVISEDINFSIFGFVDIGPGNVTPPISKIDGSITVHYDPALSYDNDTTDVVVHSLTGITAGSPLGFTYSNGYMEFGGIQNDADIVYSGTNDFVIAMNVSDPTKPTLIPCSTPGYTCGTATGSSAVGTGGYTLAAYNTGWFYSSGSIVSPNPIPTVPEPASIALMLCGLAAMGAVRRGRGR